MSDKGAQRLSPRRFAQRAITHYKSPLSSEFNVPEDLRWPIRDTSHAIPPDLEIMCNTIRMRLTSFPHQGLPPQYNGFVLRLLEALSTEATGKGIAEDPVAEELTRLAAESHQFEHDRCSDVEPGTGLYLQASSPVAELSWHHEAPGSPNFSNSGASLLPHTAESPSRPMSGMRKVFREWRQNHPRKKFHRELQDTSQTTSSVDLPLLHHNSADSLTSDPGLSSIEDDIHTEGKLPLKYNQHGEGRSRSKTSMEMTINGIREQIRRPHARKLDSSPTSVKKKASSIRPHGNMTNRKPVIPAASEKLSSTNQTGSKVVNNEVDSRSGETETHHAAFSFVPESSIISKVTNPHPLSLHDNKKAVEVTPDILSATAARQAYAAAEASGKTANSKAMTIHASAHNLRGAPTSSTHPKSSKLSRSNATAVAATRWPRGRGKTPAM